MKRALALLLVAGCAAGTLSIPIYYEPSVMKLHPGLKGRVVVAAGTAAIPVTEDVPGTADLVGEAKGRTVSFRRTAPLSGALRETGGVTERACLTQILVVRPSEMKAVVVDLYRGGDLPLLPGDIVAVPSLYAESIEAAPEWGPIERFMKGGLDRAGLLEALRRR